jgi:hypothetical protein
LIRSESGGGGGRRNHDHGGQASSWLTIDILRWMEAVIKNDRDIRYKLLWNKKGWKLAESSAER